MRLILTLAVSTGLVLLGQPQIGAAADLPPAAQEAAQTKCGTTSPGIFSGDANEQLPNPGCPPERLDWRLSQHGPGFWTADAAAPALADVSGAPRATVLRTPPSRAPADPPGCTTYPFMVVISGEPREATVVACPQPDGSWQVTQSTPGLPTQSFTVPPPPPEADAPGEDFGAWGTTPAGDWAEGPWPWFFGIAPAVVVSREFNRFDRFGNKLGHRFNRGFAHGSAVGRAVGFGHSFVQAQGFTERHDFAVGRSSQHGFGAGAGFAARHR
jgi:hypothetical protein